MKIGILTQPLHANYGGLLQNYALQQVLLRAGHEVETIDTYPFAPAKKYCKSFGITKIDWEFFFQQKS